MAPLTETTITLKGADFAPGPKACFDGASQPAASHDRVFCEGDLLGLSAGPRRPLGAVRISPDTPRDLPSVSKSVVGLLDRVAVAANRVPAAEVPDQGRTPLAVLCDPILPALTMR